MSRKQFYGIKYPFTEESDRLTFFDMNERKIDGAKSMLLHIILTPKGQRLRHPNFGTNLIKFVFEQKDSDTWADIKEDIRKQVSLYVPEINFKNINIIKDENDNSIFIEVDYSIEDNGQTVENKTLVKL
jgi:phage baseplate assembly protein W